MKADNDIQLKLAKHQAMRGMELRMNKTQERNVTHNDHVYYTRI